MHRILEYALLFVIAVLAQLLLFNNLNLSVYINPLIYIAFIVILPMELPAIAVLLLGLTMGVTMDMMMGMAGVNTIATLCTAFFRMGILNLIVGKEEVKEGGVPCVSKIGLKKYLRYSVMLIFLHCFVFFTFEALTWDYYYLTLLRIVLSTAFTVVLVYFCQLLFEIKGSSKI